jgi:starch phosphorylase
LPRHLMLIFQINNHIMGEVNQLHPGDFIKLRNMSVIEEETEKSVRMAQLSIHGSHTVNGVAALHTKILKEKVFPDFVEFYPGKFQSKTNGITQRLWLKTCNPHLASLISEHIGDSWVSNLDNIRGIEQYLPPCQVHLQSDRDQDSF